MIAGCNPICSTLSQSPSRPVDPAVPASPAIAIAESVLRHLIAGTHTAQQLQQSHDPAMAAAAGVVADCERELYKLLELQTRHQQIQIGQIFRRLQEIDDTLKHLTVTISNLQRAVLQLQEDAS